ncbi:MAG: hypothetical protein D8M57_13685 [Candidatus Scalindua sp. AMX11]|nr:MAG: hypothetical protein DWQ00_06195 [Candidatus Scalindua sp.]TDE64325.1 MAG: hypothetical protein D8M57_13685 [Candidatus Scalindua sp. AMX11]
MNLGVITTVRKMNCSLLCIGITIVVICLSLVSCKRAEEVKVKRVEERVTDNSEQDDGLAQAMKKASRVMRRLARAVEQHDWVEMDIWTQELKEGIGYYCVELYMIENDGISSEFIVLSNKFIGAINKLMLCSKKHDTTQLDLEFDSLVKSCDQCHEIFFEKVGRELEMEDLISTSLKERE